MATKSRLGKGLGALFPSLPGEPQHQEHAAPAAAAKEVKASKTDGHVESKSASATAQASVNAVQGMKHAVSRETTKKNQHRRASMPSISLNESAHPADMFFGSTAQPASEQGEQQGSVSRETTPTEHKKDEPELLPVQGGYLVELRLSDVGPNLHQPRTIFDEDDLRELAESIKEVGVLQPIVVRKRPQSQIEAARREGAAKPAEPHNMFDGRMDSMYELIMGERRWRASQIAGLKTIPAIVKTTADDDMLRDALLENLHRVAQGAVTGPVGGDQVAQVDLSPGPRGDGLRIIDREQSARDLGTQLEPDFALRGVGVSDGRLHPFPGINIGEGAKRRAQAQSAAGIYGVLLLDAFRTGGDVAPDCEGGDPLAFGGVDPQLAIENARAVGWVVSDRDPGFGAREDRLFREFGHRTAAGGHHVEDDKRSVAVVFPRERMAYRTVCFADGAEIIFRRIERELSLGC